MVRRAAVVLSFIGLVVLSLAGFVSASAVGSWSQQNGNGDGGFKGIWFVDATHGWAVGEGASDGHNSILRTTDGGANWTVPTTVPVTDTLNRVMFVDTQHGLAVGEHTSADGSSKPAAALRTSDGGDTWTQATSGTPANHDLEGVYLVSDHLTAWAVGDSGVLIKSTDGGDTWTDLSANVPKTVTGAPYGLSSIWFVSATEGWIVGDQNGSNPNAPAFHTTDGGVTWTLVDPGLATGGYESVRFVDATHGWAVGDCFGGGTCNGAIARWNGASWVDKSPTQAAGFDLTDVSFVDTLHGWAVGDISDGETTTGRVILFTADGGDTWTVQSSAVAGQPVSTPSPCPSANCNFLSGLSSVSAVDICHAWTDGGEKLIMAFTDVCPAASQQPAVTPPALPKAGQPTPNGSQALLGAAILAVGVAGFAGSSLQRSRRRRGRQTAA